MKKENSWSYLIICLFFVGYTGVFYAIIFKDNDTNQLEGHVNNVWSERLIDSHIEEIKVGFIDSFDEIKSGDTSSVSYYCGSGKCNQVKFFMEGKDSKNYFIPAVVQLNEDSYFIPMKDCQEASDTCVQEQESYPEKFEDLTIRQVGNNDYTVEVSSLEDLKKNVNFQKTQSYLDDIIEQSITISKRNYRIKEMLDVKNSKYKESLK